MGRDVNAEIRFYGGVEGKIGGNIVALVLSKSGERYAFFFDMGLYLPDYFRRTRYRVELQTLEQLQRWRLIPDLGELGEVRACFISHAHIDHWRALPAFKNSTLAPAVIWSSYTTAKIIGNNSIRTFPLTTKPFEDYIFFEDENLKERGIEIKVAPFPNDHPILGSCAWITELENNIILYTGDFRDHGFLSSFLDKKQQFWTYTKKRAKLSKKDVIIITEGTNYGLPGRFFTEEQLKARLTEIIKRFSSELITIIIDERDLCRALTIEEVLRDINKNKAAGRRVMYSRSIAQFCRKVSESFRQDYQSVLTSRELDRLRKTLLVMEPREISDEALLEAAQNPSKFLFVVTTRDGFVNLDQIAKRNQGGCCILSLSETVGEAKISTRDYAREIANLGFNVEEVHSSGHVFPNRLVDILADIQPKAIFVMHSLAPEGLCKFIKARTGLKVLAPSLGKNYEIQ